MADGQVLTGFSKPYFATYTNTSGTISYSTPTVMARGVDVSIELEDASDNNNFYADNVLAESVQGVFTGGTVKLTVDGLKDTVAKTLFGLGTAGQDGFTDYTSALNPPYVGIGFVARYMSGGTTTYVPIILTKCKFKIPNMSAKTQGEDIEWQTQELNATMMRDDSANGVWKKVGAGETTEASAVNKIITALGGTVV